MFCPSCKADIPDASQFCNKCGAPLAPAPPPAAPPAPPVAEPEQEIWRGRYSAKSQAHLWILWLFWMVTLGFLYLRFRPEGGYTWARYAFLGAAALPALGILWTWLVERLSTRYRLTTHRLFKETGIFSRHMNEIELIRVDDVSVRQNLIQRIFNVGRITVIAPTDQTEPHLELIGIENPIEIKEQIRTYVRKRRERSLHVESL